MVFGWAYMTPISGAVIASGSAVVRGKPKMVQNLDGGIVEEIRVADGDLVRAGDVLLRLDPTLLRINLEMYRNRLAETRAEISRLQAEQVNAATLVFDMTPLSRRPAARADQCRAGGDLRGAARGDERPRGSAAREGGAVLQPGFPGSMD